MVIKCPDRLILQDSDFQTLGDLARNRRIDDAMHVSGFDVVNKPLLKPLLSIQWKERLELIF